MRVTGDQSRACCSRLTALVQLLGERGGVIMEQKDLILQGLSLVRLEQDSLGCLAVVRAVDASPLARIPLNLT